MSEPNNQFYDVVIAGAGLVGASLAVSVAKQCPALSIAVVEASEQFSVPNADRFDPRVVALTYNSQNFLHSFGAWSGVQQRRACAYRDMRVWDGEGNASIHFDCRDQRREQLGHIVENSVAVEAVHEQLNGCANIHLLRPYKVEGFERLSDASLMVTLSEQCCLQASLLIAADGAHSTIRQQAEFSMREWDYGHQAIVTTVRSQKPHQFTAWQRFMASGPLAFLPLDKAEHGTDEKGRYCSIVWSCEEALAQELMSLDDDSFCRRLAAAFEHQLGDIESVDKRYAIPLRQRHAKHYVQDNIALVGDAAHTIHPLAGQGVNLGLLDAEVLSEEIARAVSRRVPLADASILRRYQRRRLGDNLLMMSAMEGFKRLFGSRDLAWQWLRNEGVRRVDSLPLLKKLIVKYALK